MPGPFSDGAYADALPTLRTPRLLLRAFVPDDDPAIVTLFSDEASLRTWAHPPFTSLEDARAYRAMLAEAFDRRAAFIWGVFADDDAHRGEASALVGVGILTRWSPNNRRIDMGYYLGSPYWGRGYATELGHGLLRWAFDTLGIHRVEAEVVPGNDASARVLGRLGFQHEARLAERLWSGEKGPYDSDLFRLFRAEFEAARDADGPRSGPEAE